MLDFLWREQWCEAHVEFMFLRILGVFWGSFGVSFIKLLLQQPYMTLVCYPSHPCSPPVLGLQLTPPLMSLLMPYTSSERFQVVAQVAVLAAQLVGTDPKLDWVIFYLPLHLLFQPFGFETRLLFPHQDYVYLLWAPRLLLYSQLPCSFGHLPFLWLPALVLCWVA